MLNDTGNKLCDILRILSWKLQTEPYYVIWLTSDYRVNILKGPGLATDIIGPVTDTFDPATDIELHYIFFHFYYAFTLDFDISLVWNTASIRLQPCWLQLHGWEAAEVAVWHEDNFLSCNDGLAGCCYKFILIFNSGDCQKYDLLRLLPVCGTRLYNWCMQVAESWEFGRLITVASWAWVPKGRVAQYQRTALVAVFFEVINVNLVQNATRMNSNRWA